MNLRRVIPVGLILIGLFWCVESIFTYQIWVRSGPGGGFISLIAGLITVVFSALILVQERWQNHQGKTQFDPMVLLPIGYMVAIVVLSKLIGLILALSVYIFLWLKIREKKSAISCTLVAIICPAVLYALFVLWLRAPLPKGLLGLI